MTVQLGSIHADRYQYQKNSSVTWQLWGAFLTQFQGWLPILDREQWKKAIMVVYSDASANPKLGWGVYVPIKGWWSYGQWNSHHMQMNNPSIDFLEMFAILVFLDMKGVDLHDNDNSLQI